MHRIFRVKAYEAEHGPHFNEEHARKAVSKMENEDGTRGPHWSVEETTALASQYGINLGSRFNRYDWFVALNMVYSDYYKVIISMTNSNSTKHFVELAKAWINDKDIDEGKMWYYYIYVMCDKIRQAEMECYEEEVEKRDKYEDDDDDEFERIGLFRRGGRRGGMMRGGRRVYSTSRARDYEDDYERIMLFNQLNIGDKVYIIEVVGTFKKTTEYNEGSVTQVSSIYDEPLPPGQFPMPNQPRKKVVDITIQCNGETKKFTIPENKSVITDNSIGLTISTDKQEIINIVRNQYDTYKQRKEAIAKCDEEMAKCQVLLDKLGVDNEPARENDKILELQKEVSELKNIIRKANQMVPPPMKEMLPQDMKNAMDKVGQ